MVESEGDREDCEIRDEENELDPLTGIPLRWARFWRDANANQSIGVGIPEPHERSSASISDGYDTMPGNYVRPTQNDDAEGAAEGDGDVVTGELGTSLGSAGAPDGGFGLAASPD